MQVKVKKLHPTAVTPEYATDGAAAFDLTAINKESNCFENITTYGTGLAFEIPKGYVGLLFPRSSVHKTCLTLANCVGVIDSDYRGEVMAKFRIDDCSDGQPYDIGDRVIQMIIMPAPQVELIEVEELSATERGNGGFGSTGK